MCTWYDCGSVTVCEVTCVGRIGLCVSRILLCSRKALVAPSLAIDAAPSHSSGEVPSPGQELSNPSDKIVLKVLQMAKISVTAAAPRCKHRCGFVDDKMEARPLAGMRPASGCGSIQRGNLEAL